MKTTSLKTAALIATNTNTSPIISLLPFPAGQACEVLFQFQRLPENYEPPATLPNTLSFSRSLLETFEDYSRLQRTCQIAYREAIETTLKAKGFQ